MAKNKKALIKGGIDNEFFSDIYFDYTTVLCKLLCQ